MASRGTRWYGNEWHARWHAWKVDAAEGWDRAWDGPRPYRPYRQQRQAIRLDGFPQLREWSLDDNPEILGQLIRTIVPTSMADDPRLTDLWMLAEMPHIVRGILALVE